MTTLITGWTGMLGQHIVREFEARVRGDSLMLLSRKARVSEPRSVGVDLTQPADFTDVDFSGVTRVIHCAAAIPARPGDFVEVNVTGTENLLAALPLDTLEAFVQISSISVYATPDNQHEDAPKTDSGYGWTKLRQEQVVRNALRESTAYSVFRPSSVYGVGMAEGTVLPIFLKRARSHQTISIDAPEYRQSFIWAGDAARFIVEAAIRGVDGVFNLFSDEVVDLQTLAEAVVQATASTSHIDVAPASRDAKPPKQDGFPIDRLRERFPHVEFSTLVDGIGELVRCEAESGGL